MSRLVLILIIVIISVEPLLARDIEVLHYNLFETKHNRRDKKYRLKKEGALKYLFNKTSSVIYSISESCREGNAVKPYIFKKSGYLLRKTPTATFNHFLYYNSEFISVSKSQNFNTKSGVVLYLQLIVKMNKAPINVFIYKILNKKSPYIIHQMILDILRDNRIIDNIVLLGGDTDNDRKALDYKHVNCARGICLKNPITLDPLINCGKQFIWKNQLDFIYLSRDFINIRNNITYRKGNAKFLKNKQSEVFLGFSKYLPIQLSLNPMITKTVYTTPKIDVIAQDTQQLQFQLSWDTDTKIEIEVISMIGNVFYSRTINYQGVLQKPIINISNLPSGIFILKTSDKQGRMKLLRFTKY